jgi:glycosyltransferase involved in cell wall biosynthesis
MKEKQLRIAMIIQRFSPFHGGAERQVEAVATALRTRDMEVCVLTRRYSGLARREVIAGIPVFRLPVPGPKAAASIAFSVGALPLLRAWKPDVIHAHDLLSPTTTAVLAKFLFRMPVVATIHSGTDAGELARLQRKFLGKQRLSIYRHDVDSFIAISREIDSQLAGLGIPLERRTYIPNGVDSDHFHPVAGEQKARLRRMLGLPEGPLAVFVGRLVEGKRVTQLADIWPSVRERFPSANILILGDGPLRAEMDRRKCEGMHNLGDIAHVAPYLQASDLFILPSVVEGLSVAILEAMACGLPILAARIGGNLEVVEDRRNGWLFAADDIPALQEAALGLIGDEDLRNVMGRRSRDRVLSEFTLQSAVERQINLYRRLRSRG